MSELKESLNWYNSISSNKARKKQLGQLVEELMEKRFTERAEELIGTCFKAERNDYNYDNDTSEFDRKLRWFIDKRMDEYLEEHKQEITEILIKQIDLSKIVLHAFSVSAKQENK